METLEGLGDKTIEKLVELSKSLNQPLRKVVKSLIYGKPLQWNPVKIEESKKVENSTMSVKLESNPKIIK